MFKKLLSYLLALGLHLVELGVENSQISLVALNLSQVGLVLFKVAFDFLLNFGLLRLGLPQLLMQVLHLELVQLCSRFRLLLKYAVKVLLILNSSREAIKQTKGFEIFTFIIETTHHSVDFHRVAL